MNLLPVFAQILHFPAAPILHRYGVEGRQVGADVWPFIDYYMDYKLIAAEGFATGCLLVIAQLILQPGTIELITLEEIEILLTLGAVSLCIFSNEGQGVGTAIQKGQIDLLRKTTVGSVGKAGIDFGDIGSGKRGLKCSKFQLVDKKCNLKFTCLCQRLTAQRKRLR